MMPRWVDQEIHKAKVRVERYGRYERGRPSLAERRFYFCGWYWFQEGRRGFVTNGPFGPFPCRSAAEADALTALRLIRED